MARKVLCSIGRGDHASLLDISGPTFEAYAERHHYDLVLTARALSDRPPAWDKVKLLAELLDDFELLLWIDADAVIIDSSVDIAQVLAPDRHVGLVAHRRGDGLIPNSGVIVLRRGHVARALLDEMWSQTHLIEHPWWENAALCTALGYTLPGSLEPGLRGTLFRLARRLAGRELRPFRAVRASPFTDRTQFLPNEWNSIHGDMVRRPRIVHFPASPLADRLAAMKAAGGVCL